MVIGRLVFGGRLRDRSQGFAASRTSEEPRNGIEEFGWLHRLDENAVLLPALRLQAIHLPPEEEMEDFRNGRPQFLLYAPGDLDTVHGRHHDIEQDEAKRTAGIPRVVEHGEGFRPARARCGLISQDREPLRGFSGCGIAIDDEDGRAVERLRCRRKTGQRPLGKTGEDREVESASFASSTLHPKTPLHEMHEFPGDRQAEAGAAVGGGWWSFRLGKGFEDGSQLIRRDADPRVLHGQMERRLVVSKRFQGNVDDHFAAFGELDGVADQVDEDLPEATRVDDAGDPAAFDWT